MHKVTRGLRERSQNSHCATTRVIRKKRQALLNRGLQSTVPASRNEPEASEVLHLPHGIIIMSKNQKCWRRQFQPHGWKSVGCLAPVTQRNVLDFKMSRMSHTPREMDRAQKNEHGMLVKRPSERSKTGQPFCASLRSRSAREHLTRELVCENLQFKSRGPDGAPWSNPGLLHLTSTVRTPQCGHTVWGKVYVYTNLLQSKLDIGKTWESTKTMFDSDFFSGRATSMLHGSNP